ncbi:MAG: Gfo/Idh/MocA family protein [Acidimicrobiia bacterium]
MQGTVRVGLVGASASGAGWSSIAHVPGLQAADGIELAAVCTSRPESAEAAANRYGVPGFHDVRDLVAQDDIDLVSVVVRVPKHRDVVMAAIDGRKHVFSEWPLGADLAEAKQMAARAEEVGIATAVGLQGRHDPHLTLIRDLHVDGWLGRVVAVSVTMFGDGALGHTSQEAWMGNAANGANFLTIVGGHVIDAISYCVAPFAEVSATVTTQFPDWSLSDTGETISVDAPDSVAVEGELEGGVTVSLHAASVPHNASGWRMQIYGTEGTIVASTSGLPQITPIELLGARGSDSLEVLSLPPELTDEMPPGPAGNVGRAYQHLAKAITEQSAFTPDFAHAKKLHVVLDSL